MHDFRIPEDASIAQVGRLLASFRSNLKRLSVPEQHKMAAQERLGMRALDWTMKLEGLDQRHIASKQFSYDLGWLLVAEKEDYGMAVLVVWMMRDCMSLKEQLPGSELRTLYHGNTAIGCQLRRRHDLLSGLIHGYLHFSSDGTANEAIGCLSTLFNAAQEHGVFGYFQWAGPLIGLRLYLNKAGCKPCDERKFDHFCEMQRAIMSKKDYEREAAWTLLYHPTRPDTAPALRAMERELHEGHSRREGRSAMNHVGACLLRALYILELQGHAQEARWARETLKEHFGQVWHSRRRTTIEFELDSKLEPLRSRRAQAETNTIAGEDGSSHAIGLRGSDLDTTSEVLATSTSETDSAAGFSRERQPRSLHQVMENDRTTRKAYDAAAGLVGPAHVHSSVQLEPYNTDVPHSADRYLFPVPKDATVDQVGQLLAKFRSHAEQ